MRIRRIVLLGALLSLAVAPAALADEHGGKGKGKTAEKAREKAPDEAEQARERAEERTRTESAGEDAGKARGEEMRERREERKRIMEEAKGSAEPGTPRKGKKPWWRFWESDEDYEASE
jgi:hypothetical protein